MSLSRKATGQSVGYFRAIFPIVSSVIASVRFTGIPLLGQHLLGTIQASHSIRYLDSHLDILWREAERSPETSFTVRFHESISSKSLILICIIEKQRYLGHMG